MHVGVQAGSLLPICAKSELAAERKGNGKSEMANGKAKWQSEMAKRKGKSEMRSKALQGPSPRFRTAPAVSGKVYEKYENSDVGVCEGFRLNK
jgi:hypothetical protein